MTEISRRELIARSAAAAATAAFGTILVTPPLAFADPADPEIAFGKISEILTGISAGILNPNVDPLRLNHEIFSKINEKPERAKTLALMLQKFSSAKPEEQADVVKSMATKWDKASPEQEAICFLGRSIILAWYLGAWYEPDSLKQKSYAKAEAYEAYRRYSANVLIPHAVLSSNAYMGAMVWRVMQAHPMGYSNRQFGYWADKPPDLASFIQPIPLPGDKK